MNFKSLFCCFRKKKKQGKIILDDSPRNEENKMVELLL